VKQRGKRAVSIAASAMTLAAGMVLAGPANPANAAPNVTFRTNIFSDGSARVDVFNDGTYAGVGMWSANPGSLADTGDTLIAHDQLADGYGIEATLDDGRTATTRGHSAPYTDTNAKDLDEGARRLMTVCLVKGTFKDCRKDVPVNA